MLEIFLGMDKIVKTNNKGEKMSLRKFISLLLLVAFSFQAMPANAASLSNSASTLPTIAADAGSIANGANRDVVPLPGLRFTLGTSELVMGRIGGLEDELTDIAIASVSANGQLVLATNGRLSIDTQRALVIQPPSGTEFVGLPVLGFNGDQAVNLIGPGLASNGMAATNVDATAMSAVSFPDAGSNGKAIVAGVLTENGPAATFGSVIPKGSLVAYFLSSDGNITGDTYTGGQVTIPFQGLALAANPAVDSSLATSGSISAAVVAISGGTAENAIASLSGSASVATAEAPAGQVEFLMLGETTGTETSTTAEPDAQNNSALASQLGAAATTVAIGPGYVTSTGSSLTQLNVDTDTLLLRAAENTESTASAKVYRETPFATSALVVSAGTNGQDATTLNTALTNATVFPNTANALMTVTFTVVDASTGTALSDGTTIDVAAANVTLFGQKAFDGVRNTTVGGESEALGGTNGGFLGAAVFDVTNGVGLDNTAVGVLYNGVSATGDLRVQDASSLDFDGVTTRFGMDFTTNATTATATVGGGVITALNGTAAFGLFPGSIIVGPLDSNRITQAFTTNATVLNTSNGLGANPFSASSAASTIDDAQFVFAHDEVTARLVDTAANAFFAIIGNNNGNALSAATQVKLSATNLATSTYTTAPTIQNGPTSVDAANTGIAVARLEGNVVSVLPLANRYDNFRDAIAIRPEITLSLGATAKANGVRVIATATGGNINGSVEKTVASILAAGSLDVSADLQVLPVDGSLAALMVENGTLAGNGRAAVTLESVTGAGTTTDSLADIIGTSAVLDETVPPLFCGGSIGDGTRGPNGAIFQPKARAIVITENGTDAFETVTDNANTVIRVLLPAGVDLNSYTATEESFLGIISSFTGAANRPFNSAPTITRAQNIEGAFTQAFVDINVGSLGTPTSAVMRQIGLIFKPNALVVPSNVSDLTATVQVVFTGTTSAYGAVITDDVVLDTIGTVSLASGCSTFLTLEYCDDSLSSFVTTSPGTSEVEADYLAQGSNLVSFTAPTDTKRLITSGTGAAVTVPDLCISEGVADALPVGEAADGVPNQFGESTITANGTVTVNIISSFEGTNNVGLAGAPTVRTSDNSVDITATGTANNVSNFTVAEGTQTNRNRAFEETTTFRVTGLTMDLAPSGNVPPAQSFIAYVTAVAGAGTYNVGTNFPLSLVEDSVNGNTFVNVNAAASEEVHYAALTQNGNLQDGSVASTDLDPDDDSSGATNDLSIVFAGSNAPILSDAVAILLDDSNYVKLNAETVLSVSVDAITGSTDVTATVSATAGSLEAGSLVTVSTSGTGPTDSVTVPVAADGSFAAQVRAATTQSLTVVQTPTSAISGDAPQIRQLDVENQNVEPVLVSATITNILPANPTAGGEVPVLITVSSAGKLNDADYLPVASELTFSGSAVTAVNGSTTQFIGVVDYSLGAPLVLESSAGSGSSVTATGLTTETQTSTKVPNLFRKVKNDGKGRIVIRGKRLSNNNELFGFVLDDGTFTSVELRNKTKGDKKRRQRRSTAAATIPSNAVYTFFHVDGRGGDVETPIVQ